MITSRSGFFFSLCAAFALMIFSTTSAEAQQVFGSIFGTVTDASGGAVNNAKVTITDINKGASFDVTTNESGNYTKGQLIAGTYRISIEAAGFSKTVSNDITVNVDQAVRFEASLSVGNVQQQVEVTASAPLLQTDRADISQTFTSEQINAMPSIGRNTQSLELLNPGTEKLGWQHASDENPQGSVQMEVNGQLFSAMGYELDGTTNQDPILGIIVINPNFDSLNSIEQANQNFDSEFQYVGGGVAVYTTKSGSNDFHGSAFEYLQINSPGFTDFGRDPFSQPLGAPLYRQNQFGGSIGGRVIKDKLFFFGDAQLNRQAQGGSVLTTVPTAQMRTGDLSEYLAAGGSNYQVYDPMTGDQTTGVGRTPFPNNQIPTNRLSPQALALMSYFPLPNTNVAGTSYQNNFATNGDVAITGNSWDTRWDYYLNEKNSVFGRYSYAAFTEQAPGAFGLLAGGPNFGNYAGDSQAKNQSLAAGWTHTASPTLINEFRFGWMKYHVFDIPNGYGTDPATQAGIPGLNLDQTYTSGMPYFDIQNPNSDDTKLGYALGVNQCNCPLTQTESQYQFVDNVTKIHGNHTFKFGADLRWAQNLRVPSDSHRAGELTFKGGDTANVETVGGNPVGGLAMASFLLGDVDSFARYVSASTNAQERQRRWFWYGQDTWRPTPKLTLNIGLRWEWVFPESVNEASNGATLDLNSGLMYVFGAGSNVSSHGIQDMNWHNFAPRVGLAYQLNQKTVIRAGYGWAYNLGTFGSTFGHNVTQNPPVLIYQNNTPSNPFTPIFTLASGPPPPATITVSPDGTFPLPAGVSPKFRPPSETLPVNYTYNIAIQRQVTQKIQVTAAYVGNSARHNFIGTGQTTNPNEAVFVPGVTNTNLDRPYYPKFGWTQDLQYFCDCSNEQYNSLQTTVTVRALAGWTLQGNYTYQREFGDGWDPYDSNYYFLYDRSSNNKGYDSQMPWNQLTFTQNFDVPFGHGRKWGSSVNKAVDLILGGWNLSATTFYYSGIPFSPTLENYGPNTQPNVGPKGRPNLGSGSAFAGAQDNRNQWFVGCPDQVCTSGAFVYPDSNTFGNYPINVLFGPHFIDQDFSMGKDFNITERLKFTLRADSTNVFNHTNLGSPNNDVQSATAGQITSLAFGGGNMRRMQYSARFTF
jgi:hypothetical protein